MQFILRAPRNWQRPDTVTIAHLPKRAHNNDRVYYCENCLPVFIQSATLPSTRTRRLVACIGSICETMIQQMYSATLQLSCIDDTL